MKRVRSDRTSWWLEAFAAALVFGGLLGFSSYLLYQKSLNALEQEIKLGLMSNVRAAAKTLPADLHQRLDASKGSDDPLYRQLASQMETIRQQTQDVRYIYTIVRDQGRPAFMVNPSPQSDGDGDGQPDVAPALLTPYVNAPTELIAALQQGDTRVSAHPYHDQWGTFISAYAPIVASDGQVVAILAMDLELSSFFHRLKPVSAVFGKAVLIIVFLSLTVGLLVYVLRGRASVTSAQVRQLQQQLSQAEAQCSAVGSQQLSTRGLLWCWRFGCDSGWDSGVDSGCDGDSKRRAAADQPTIDCSTVLPTLQLPAGSKQMQPLLPWFDTHRRRLLPSADSLLQLDIPTECDVWLVSDHWLLFWQHTFALWQQAAGRALHIKVQAVDLHVESWQLQVTLAQQQPFWQQPAVLQHMAHRHGAEATVWASFLQWQQLATALGVRYQLQHNGQLLLCADVPAWPVEDV